MSFLGYYSTQEYAQLQDQYTHVQESLGKCRKELLDLKTRTNPLLRENANLCQTVHNLNQENTQLINSMKALSDHFNQERERVQTEIEKGLIIELSGIKEEKYNLSIQLRDARSIIDHITFEGANFYITDMIKFIREKQQVEKPTS